MNLVKEYNNRTKVEEKSISSIVSYMFKFGGVQSEYTRIGSIKKKESINNTLLFFLENILSNDLVSNKSEKLEIIKVISTLNLRNEILEAIEEKISKKKLANISERLNKKTLSSFK